MKVTELGRGGGKSERVTVQNTQHIVFVLVEMRHSGLMQLFLLSRCRTMCGVCTQIVWWKSHFWRDGTRFTNINPDFDRNSTSQQNVSPGGWERRAWPEPPIGLWFEYSAQAWQSVPLAASAAQHSPLRPGMGIVWVFSDTGAKPVLLKRYRCLNGAWTDISFFLNAQWGH